MKELVGISRVTAWPMERSCGFPRRRKIGPKLVAWVEDEIRQWLAERPTVGGA